MIQLQVTHWYPSSTYFGEDSGNVNEYECSSFLATMKGKEECDLYRLVIRVKDRAYQVVRNLQEYQNPLYFDRNCQLSSPISITKEWIVSSRPPKIKIHRSSITKAPWK